MEAHYAPVIENERQGGDRLHDNNHENEDNSEWCANLTPDGKGETKYTYDQSKIDEIDKYTFSDAERMPYIYTATAIYMLYDSDIDGAIDLLHKLIGRYANRSDNHKSAVIDINVYYLLSWLAYTDARPIEYYMEYDENILNIAKDKLEELYKSSSGDAKKALIKRYETAVNMAKNNISYVLVRKQSRLTDDDFDKARKYANEAYGYANNSKDPVYIDTLGYVKLVTVLRNGGLSSEQQKHEIESARILLERAYSIAKDEYKAIVDKEKVDAIKESEARQDLMIYEDHLNEALRYEAELNRME